MTVFAGQGDQRRSMLLLWRAVTPASARSAPGPRPGLSVDAIAETAIAVADEEGIGGLSMRAVGERLGHTAMALYTYVPGKSELIEVMYDHALTEGPTDYELAGGWRQAITRWVEGLRAVYLRHPWMLHLSQARPVLGPNEFAVLESLVGILDESEVPAGIRRGVCTTLFDVARGAARTVVEAREAASATGVSDEEWWFARSPILDEVAPDFAQRYPMMTRLESEGVYQPEDDTTPYLEQKATSAFETGLAVVLDGIAANIPAGHSPTETT